MAEQRKPEADILSVIGSPEPLVVNADQRKGGDSGGRKLKVADSRFKNAARQFAAET